MREITIMKVGVSKITIKKIKKEIIMIKREKVDLKTIAPNMILQVL